MKLIPKYEQKFVELLKEMREELGANLCVKVQSKSVYDQRVGEEKTQYEFEVSAPDRWHIE